ncbi:hypothetical protein [Streptosporangium sandarakinum]|uniref:hypothetical protein n=1 Tax=Streptosporangium sandarakinum TaxID=1260955 RepID=UPI0036919F3D
MHPAQPPEQPAQPDRSGWKAALIGLASGLGLLAVLGIVLVAERGGGGITPQGLVDQLKTKGYACENTTKYADSVGLDEDIVVQCNPAGAGGLLSLVYDSREELLSHQMPPELVQALKEIPAIFKSQQALVDDLSYPYWEVICFDRNCADAGRQLGWLEINP